MFMSKKTLSHIDPVSLGKWTAVFSLVVMGLMLLTYLPFLVIGLFMTEVALTGLIAAIFGGLIFVVVIAGIYAIFGFVMGFTTAYFYNWFAGRFGGLELEFEDS